MLKFLTFFAIFVTTVGASAQSLTPPRDLKCSPYETAKAFLKNLDGESNKNSQFNHRSFIANTTVYLFELNGSDNLAFHIPATRLILGEKGYMAADIGIVRISSDGCRAMGFSGGSAISVSE